MIKATINGEKVVLTTSVEDIRDEKLYCVSEAMLNLIYKYEKIANKGTAEEDFMNIPWTSYPNKPQDNANERTLRYIAEKLFKDKNYNFERIDSPDATNDERKILLRVY